MSIGPAALFPGAPLLLAASVAALAAVQTASAGGAGGDAPTTASQIVDRIKQQLGVPWTEPTVDTFLAGDPNTQVKGVAVTMMATLEVLRKAAAAGQNLVITHEPVYYGHEGSTTDLEKEHDPVFEAKRAFIREQGLVIWRLHDHLHRKTPDAVHAAMVRALGWEKYRDPGSPDLFRLPSTTLKDLALKIKSDLGIHVLRVVGDPASRVSAVGISEGFGGFTKNRRIFRAPGAEVLVFGEAHEWETIEYGADAVALGDRKGLIILGHIPSEQAGMEEFARWLKPMLGGVPVGFVPAPEPFWAP